MSQDKRSNRARAPFAAKTVDVLREVFGDVKVLYAYEGDFKTGEKQEDGAPCFNFAILELPYPRRGDE